MLGKEETYGGMTCSCPQVCLLWDSDTDGVLPKSWELRRADRNVEYFAKVGDTSGAKEL